MRVLYDISPLVHGWQDDAKRAGVCRVVENLAEGLSRSLGDDLSLCADFDPGWGELARRGLANHPRLNPHRFVPAAMGRLRSYRALRAQRDAMTAAPRSSAGRLGRGLRRVLRKALVDAVAGLEAVGAGPSPVDLRDHDIYHSTFFALPPTVRKNRRLRRFLTAYDLIPLLFPRFFVRGFADFFDEIYRSLSPEDWVVSISESTKADLCNRYRWIDPERVFVTPLGGSDAFYPCGDPGRITATLARYGVPGDVPYFLSLNTLEPRKNVDHTIRCFYRLVREQRIGDLNLVLAGGKGWQYEPIIEATAAGPELRDRVVFTGYVADKDLAALYSGSIGFVYPSFYEGFGLPPLEAMQCGVPVITSNTSSLPEVVGDAGIMVSPTDSDALCQALLRVYGSSETRREMSRKSVERARRFSWASCTAKTLAAYETALRNP